MAIRRDYLDGLYTDPAFVEQGIGTELLGLRERGVHAIRAEASWNAEKFCFRRGYEPPAHAHRMAQRLIVKRLIRT